MICESIKMVFKVFRTNKLRTFLTMLGIIIGIFAITIIFAVSNATQESVKGELNGIDISSITVQITATRVRGRNKLCKFSTIRNVQVERK